jgi:hypothetical protein
MIVIASCILLGGFIAIYENKSNAKIVANEYFQCYLRNDFKKMYEYVDVDEDEFIYVYDKKANTLKNKETKEKLFYAQQYKEGPSGKYTNKDDDDITLTFKNGTVTYDDDGDDEQFTYYVYVDKKDVYVVFYGEEFDESDFYDEYHVSGFSFNAKKDKFTIGGTDYKK